MAISTFSTDPSAGMTESGNRQSINRIGIRDRATPLNALQIPAWRDETSPSDVNFVHHSREGHALSDVLLGGQPGNGSFDAETDLKNLP